MKSALEIVKTWLNELLYRTNDIENHFQIEQKERSIHISFYTKNNKYSLIAKETYLGCGVSSRKPRAGEDWTRGNDLPDGTFSQETWDRIKNAIISYELVKIAQKEILIAEQES